jgi:hypothetical protein
LLFAAMIVLLLWLVLPWLAGRTRPVWPFGLAAVFVAWALLAPASLAPVYRGWLAFGRIMSRITTPVLLGGVFFLLLTPIGLLRRRFAGDPLEREWDRSRDSYRKPSEALPPERFDKPF